jgi:hypothetical protein
VRRVVGQPLAFLVEAVGEGAAGAVVAAGGGCESSLHIYETLEVSRRRLGSSVSAYEARHSALPLGGQGRVPSR